MLKLRTQIHPFQSGYEDSEIEQNTIRNIFNSLNTGTDIKNSVILVEDEVISDDYDRIPKDGSHIYIRIIPEGDNTQEAGKGMGWGGVGTILLGIAACFIPVVGSALGVALIGAGIGCALGGFVIYNMDLNIPGAQNEEKTKPEQDPSIRGARNQARPYGSIPVILGRHLISADIAAEPYIESYGGGQGDANDDSGQYIKQLFCIGYNDIEIDANTIKIGDSPIANISGSQNLAKVLSGEDPIIALKQDSCVYGNRAVKGQNLNSVLKHGQPIIRTTAPRAKSVTIDIFFPYGLFEYGSGSDTKSRNVRVNVYYKKANESDGRYKLWDNHTGGGCTFNITKNVARTIRRSTTIGFGNYGSEDTVGEYTIKIERVTEDSDDNRIVDNVYVGSINTSIDDPPVRSERASSLMLVSTSIKASESAQGIIDTFNCVATSVLPDYNGRGTGPSAWVRRATQNPASEILYVLRGQINSTPVADGDIDWPAFEEFWRFCEEKKYYFNGVLTEPMTLSNLYASIAKVGRGSITKTDGKFSVSIDRQKNSPVQLFTPRNTIGFSESILLPDIPDQIDYNFIDEKSGWRQNSLSVYNTPLGTLSGIPKSRQETTVWGITDQKQLFKFARYQYAVSNLRKSVYTIQCDLEYLMCQKGDLIEYAGDRALSGVAYGRVKDLILDGNENIIGIVSDTVLNFESGKEYGIRVRKASGRIESVSCLNTRTSERHCMFTAAATGIEPGDLFTFGVRSRETLPLVITEIAPGENLTALVTAVDYAPAIFNVDNNNYAVPEFKSNVTVSGVTDTGYQPIWGWQTYRVYHDSKAPPQPPGEKAKAAAGTRYTPPKACGCQRKPRKTSTAANGPRRCRQRSKYSKP